MSPSWDLQLLPGLRCYGRRGPTLAESMLCLIVGPLQFILGWHGNCTGRRYAVQLDVLHRRFPPTHRRFPGLAACAKLTVRTPNGLETTSYLSLRRPWFSWNSEHLARRFGTTHEAPFGTVYQYDGWLGSHHWL